VIIYPTAVQGDAPGQIVRAIALANARQECDVLIVGRGGGSLEDLWSFNDERVARAIFASQIPIVSAVGHETDVTIADFVADLRAPTPSAAAEIVSRNQQELLRQLQSGQQRLEMAMDYFLASRQRRFTQLFHRLQQQHPQLRWPASRPPWNACASGCASPWNRSLSAPNSGKSAPFSV
jgi:exodeoxyribonuclease VII large subunit